MWVRLRHYRLYHLSQEWNRRIIRRYDDGDTRLLSKRTKRWWLLGVLTLPYIVDAALASIKIGSIRCQEATYRAVEMAIGFDKVRQTM